MDQQLEEFPFSLGQLVESKSNIKGFRGAWFRSEIKNIQVRRGEIWCAMHYIDFPDEKTNFMKAYQQDLLGKKKRGLMVRPSFPSICMGFVESVIKDAVGPVVVVDGGWWVGDLVDWFTDSCFWAAKITAVISKEIVQIELPSSPFGEGGSYEAAIKDIRPSLEWDMDHFWTVPIEKLLRPHATQAHTMDASSDRFSSPVKTLQTLDAHHIFIAKQETVQMPLFQDRNKTSDVHDDAQFKRYSMDFDTQVEGIRPFDAIATDSAFTFSETIPARAGPYRAMASLKVHGNEAAARPWVTGEKSGPVDSLDTGFGTSKSPPGQWPQLQQLSSRDGGVLASSSCQTSEDPNHVHLTGKTDRLEALTKTTEQTIAVESISKADFEQKASNDAFSALQVTGDELNIALRNEQLLDLNNESIGSSIVALEEQISRIAWLKGVMRLGLKGWSKERRKRKWVFCNNTGDEVRE